MRRPNVDEPVLYLRPTGAYLGSMLVKAHNKFEHCSILYMNIAHRHTIE